ncbi:MAG: ABC transporter permease [Defluviitaleaceae bacterium]|nr:ABC transporter permease [Defluviitaleaceae bacterium]
MWKTVVRRLLIFIPQIIVVSIIVFFAAQAMPGDAISGLIGEQADAAEVAHLRAIHGLDRPIHEQYLRWVGGILTEFDFGMSIAHSRPVTDLIGDRAGNTFRLSLLTLVFTYAIGVPLGVTAGRRRGTILDKIIVTYTFFAIAMPTLIFALINLFIFGFQLELIPIRGSVSVEITPGTFEHVLSRLHHLVAPALTGALLGTVAIINFLRSEVIETQNSDYVTTARSKGVPTRVIYRRHILRNSVIPVVGGFGMAIAFLLSGTIFIERVFSYPGMGDLFISSIINRDFPVANTLILMFAFFGVVGTLLGDIFLAMVDPRIRIR